MPISDAHVELILKALRAGHSVLDGSGRAGTTYAARGRRFVAESMDEGQSSGKRTLDEGAMRAVIVARPEPFLSLVRLPFWELVGDALRRGDLALARASLPAAIDAGDPYDHARYLEAALREDHRPLMSAERDALRAGLPGYGDYHALMTTLRYERSARTAPIGLAYYASLISRLGESAHLIYHRGDFKALAGDREGALADYAAALTLPTDGDLYLRASIGRMAEAERAK